jgi:hypothetical protein
MAYTQTGNTTIAPTNTIDEYEWVVYDTAVAKNVNNNSEK